MLPCFALKHDCAPRINKIRTLIMKKSSKACAICIEGFKED